MATAATALASAAATAVATAAATALACAAPIALATPAATALAHARLSTTHGLTFRDLYWYVSISRHAAASRSKRPTTLGHARLRAQHAARTQGVSSDYAFSFSAGANTSTCHSFSLMLERALT